MNKKNKETMIKLIVNEIEKRYGKSIDFQEINLKAELESENVRDFIISYFYMVLLNGKKDWLCDNKLERIKYDTVHDICHIKGIRISENTIVINVSCYENENHYKCLTITEKDLDKPILNIFLEKGIL